MSRDDYTFIEEVGLGKYKVVYGMGDNDGKEVLYTDDLVLAIKTAREFGAEYGIDFHFLSDKSVPV